MKNLVIGAAIGYFVGSSIVESVFKGLPDLPGNLDAGQTALLAGGAIYLATPFSGEANQIIAGFLLGAGAKMMTPA